MERGIECRAVRTLIIGKLDERDRSLERTYGIRYLAPADARDTRLPAGSIDLVARRYSSRLTRSASGPQCHVSSNARSCASLLRPDSSLKMTL